MKPQSNLVKKLFIFSFIFILINSSKAQDFQEQTSISLAGVDYSSVVWGDYNNDGYLDILLTGSNGSANVSKIYKNNGDGTFTEQTSISLTNVSHGSVAWGDYNNDGFLDILLTGNASTGYISKIYKNNGDGTFTEQTSISLTGAGWNSAAWSDYNNDGYLDILITGYTNTSYISKIYKNNGDGSFTEQTSISLTGAQNSSAAWGDYNNDGYPDILLTGDNGSGTRFSKIYKNNGDGTFTEQTAISLTAINSGSAAWGDYNNDGFLDILLTGYTGATYVSKVYKNNGDGTFTEQTAISLTGVNNSSVAWGDYNNDGYLDILLSGNTGSTYISKIYKNNGDGTFTEQSSISLTGVYYASAAFGDYNNDGKLDLLLSGYTGSSYVTKLYKNIGTYAANTAPTAPANLQQTISFYSAKLSWNKASDTQTSQNGLNYNIRVGTTPGSSNILSPMASNADGTRRKPALGNISQKTNGYVLNNLPVGTYYWSVQAIDNAFAGGAWATEASFTITTATQASSLIASNTTINSMKLSWTNGNSDKRIVFIAEGNKGGAMPTNNTSYSANASFGLGTQIGSTGWYCVYNGTGTEVIVTGLKDGTAYTVMVLEYTGTAGAESYNASTASGNPITTQTKSLLDEQTTITLAGVSFSSVAWGDYNNDGYLDILLTGTSNGSPSGAISKIYKNNGDGTFTEQTGILLTGGYGGSVAWGDYNNDGYLDILLTGYSGYSYIAKIYKNNGDGTFTEQTNIPLTGVYLGSVAWGDYNNDGYLDILLTGYLGSSYVSKIYKNNGDGTFTEQTSISLTGVNISSVAWGDYNNDGFLDILLTGYSSGSSYVSKIYKNNGDGTFTEQTSISLTGVNYGSVAWGDYNNDGYLDILLSGSTGSLVVSKIYKNNGNGTFTEQTGVSLTGVNRSSLAWGDYNNDGNLDILLTGYNSSNVPISKIYKNNGDGTFTELTNIPLTGVYYASAAWGDYNNDGKLDLLLSGYTGSSYVTKLYKNIGTFAANIAPAAPANLQQTTNFNTAKLTWDKATDAQTSQYGLNYNIRVGTTSGSSNIVSPMSSNTDGTRRKPSLGNIQNTNGYAINNLPVGTYYWSVQAIDNAFTGGAWATEASFTITATQASALVASNVTLNGMKLNWTNGNSDKRVVFMAEGNKGLATPVNNTTYNSNTAFGSGTQIGSSGWYCIYNGTGTEVTVTGLKDGTTYTVMVLEYTGTAGAENYNTSAATGNPSSTQTKSNLDEQTTLSLAGVNWGSVVWGDYNNDGFLDILLTGDDSSNKPVSKIYKNNGNGTFVEQTGITLTAVDFSSAAWGDYNNDGNLDILLTGNSSSGKVSKIYKNNGDGTFTEQTSVSLTGVSSSSSAWGDYNNDGYLDILLTGSTSSSIVSKVYKNNGDGTFTEQTSISLTGVYNGSVAWGDYNNDGFFDILLTGYDSANKPVSKIYKNNGDGTFTEQTSISLTGVYSSSVAWGDYNNDGFLDILLTGSTGPTNVSKVYKNNGDGTFSEQTSISLTNVSNGSAVWGDFNNDGYLDILISGSIGLTNISKIYKNNGNETFTEQTNIPLIGVRASSAAWGDYNNDGKLDLLLSGYAGPSYITKLYKNIGSYAANTAPTAPANLQQTISFNVAKLTWDKATDAQTSQNGLNYNIRVGTTPGNSNIVSPMAYNTDGTRLKPALGNISQKTDGYVVNNLPAGTYYWSVQAIDNAFAGGTWATETSFTVTSAQASAVIASNLTINSMKVSWNNGNSDKRIVFMAEDNKGSASPANNTTYTANTAFGTGTQIGSSGWYCVYSGTGTEVTVTGLKDGTNYTIMVLEFTGAAGAENYNTKTGNGNPLSAQTKSILEEQTTISLAGVDYSSVAWGDYNNDGYLDILLTGYSGSSYVSKIYKNNGDGTFSEQTSISLTSVNHGSVAWGDYNNDGFLDILLTGNASTGYVSKIYKNNGDGTFIEQTSIALTGAGWNSSSWNDYNNDGYLDILITGYTNTSYISKIYKNNGDGTFSEQTSISLTGAQNSSAAWGDYNNDGYPDILLTGDNGSGTKFSKIYKNNGDGTFAEQTAISLTGVNNSSVAWGDYNNDGYLDILLTGYASTGYVSKVYKNNGDGTFTEQTSISLTGINYGSVAWGDYNNDGYLDILLSGSTGSTYVSKIYKNNGDGTFTEQTNIPLTGVYFASAAWGDYNNDGKLDLLLSGYTGSSYITKLYKNIGTYAANTAPNAPGNLQQTVTFNSAKLTWDKGTDAQTSQNGLSYNIRVGSTPGSSNIVSPMASNVDGTRRKPSLGNISQKTNGFILNNLPAGTYYWSVQAIDNAFAGGAWATEASFTITAVQASTIRYSSISPSSLKISWTNGSSTTRCVFIVSGSKGIPLPTGNTTYTANTTFGSGSQIGTTGWYCVYNGSGSEVIVSGFTPSTTYTVAVIEYNGSAGSESYNISTANGNPAQYIPNFIEQTSTGIDNVNGLSTWGDYDNDEDLDLLLSGTDISSIITKLYTNKGKNRFVAQTKAVFTPVSNGAATWLDYNNDGKPDLFIMGSTDMGGLTQVAKLYKNNGDSTFTEQTGLPFIGLRSGSSTVCDFNNDGYQDLLITGQTDLAGTNHYTKMYKNNGDGTFTEQTGTGLPNLSAQALWSDFDKDGNADVLLSGDDGTNAITKLYKNNGNGTFTEVTGFVASSFFIWTAIASCDYNNDGYPDILIGRGGSTILFKNNGNNTFTQVINIPFGNNSPALCTADLNNDGRPDIISCGYENTLGKIKVFYNNGDDTYTGAALYENANFSGNIIQVADFNGDLSSDIFVLGSELFAANKFFANNCQFSNTRPNSPTGLASISDDGSVTLKWKKATDAQTPADGLTYNVNIRSSSSSLRLSPMSNSTGTRAIISQGNACQDTFLTVKKLAPGTYYWKVQSIDNAYTGGLFTTEGSFVVYQSPSGQATNIVISNITSKGATISWTNGNGSKRAVFVKKNDLVPIKPINNSTYTANAQFGLGSEIVPDGWYCVYNSTGSGITISGLTSSTTYQVMVCEYNGSAGSEIYQVASANGNPDSFVTTNSVGIEKITPSEELSIYPNPAHNFFTIKQENLEISTLEITDLDGKIILTKTIRGRSEEIDITELQSGLYLVKIKNKKGTKIKKLVVE